MFKDGFEKTAVSMGWAINKVAPGIANSIKKMQVGTALKKAKNLKLSVPDNRGVIDRVKDTYKAMRTGANTSLKSFSPGFRDNFRGSLRALAGRK